MRLSRRRTLLSACFADLGGCSSAHAPRCASRLRVPNTHVGICACFGVWDELVWKAQALQCTRRSTQAHATRCASRVTVLGCARLGDVNTSWCASLVTLLSCARLGDMHTKDTLLGMWCACLRDTRSSVCTARHSYACSSARTLPLGALLNTLLFQLIVLFFSPLCAYNLLVVYASLDCSRGVG